MSVLYEQRESCTYYRSNTDRMFLSTGANATWKPRLQQISTDYFYNSIVYRLT